MGPKKFDKIDKKGEIAKAPIYYVQDCLRIRFSVVYFLSFLPTICVFEFDHAI